MISAEHITATRRVQLIRNIAVIHMHMHCVGVCNELGFLASVRNTVVSNNIRTTCITHCLAHYASLPLIAFVAFDFRK